MARKSTAKSPCVGQVRLSLHFARFSVIMLRIFIELRVLENQWVHLLSMAVRLLLLSNCPVLTWEESLERQSRKAPKISSDTMWLPSFYIIVGQV